MKPKLVPPKASGPQRLSATYVKQLITLLARLPKDAKVYGTDQGEIAVWQKGLPGDAHIAYIDLKGI